MYPNINEEEYSYDDSMQKNISVCFDLPILDDIVYGRSHLKTMIVINVMWGRGREE